MTKAICPKCGHEVCVVNMHTVPILEAHDITGRRIAPGKQGKACTGSGMILQLK